MAGRGARGGGIYSRKGKNGAGIMGFHMRNIVHREGVRCNHARGRVGSISRTANSTWYFMSALDKTYIVGVIGRGGGQRGRDRGEEVHIYNRSTQQRRGGKGGERGFCKLKNNAGGRGTANCAPRTVVNE